MPIVRFGSSSARKPTFRMGHRVAWKSDGFGRISAYPAPRYTSPVIRGPSRNFFVVHNTHRNFRLGETHRATHSKSRLFEISFPLRPELWPYKLILVAQRWVVLPSREISTYRPRLGVRVSAGDSKNPTRSERQSSYIYSAPQMWKLRNFQIAFITAPSCSGP